MRSLSYFSTLRRCDLGNELHKDLIRVTHRPLYSLCSFPKQPLENCTAGAFELQPLTYNFLINKRGVFL